MTRIFIGSSQKNRVEEKLLIRSLRAYARQPLEINILDGDTGSVRWQSGEVGPLPGIGARQAGGATKFSLARFAIPELCGFRGRAIYCDSDQLVFCDIAQLAQFDLGSSTAAAVRVADAICAEPYRRSVLRPLQASAEDYFLTSVMLIDCERAHTWDIAALQQQIADKVLDYTGVMFFGKRERDLLGVRVAALPPEWNCLDAAPPNARLLHFTDLSSQPWRYPHNPVRAVWEKAFFAALDEGVVDQADLAAAYRAGGLDARTRYAALLAPAIRRPLHAAWTAALNWMSIGGWRRRLDAWIARRLPDTSWHWKRKQRFVRKLAWWLRLVTQRSTGQGGRFVFLVSSAADERVLVPVAKALAGQREARVSVVLAGSRSQRQRVRSLLAGTACKTDRDGVSLMHAMREPAGTVAALCLDHRLHYRHHRLGVDVADAMRRAGVMTVCLQHGGTRTDSLASLASSASQRILVWGEATARSLASDHGVPAQRIIQVGNPLHDRLATLSRDVAREALVRHDRPFMTAVGDRKLVLLATTIQREYADYPDEQERYIRYLRHVYASMDFGCQSLVIKIHPCDLEANRNLYEELRPSRVPAGSVLIVRAEDPPDVYTLLRACDVLLTRCSTVAEEALLVGVPVVAFDLERDGPASGYGHLASLGPYQSVTISPENALREAIEAACGAHRSPSPSHRAIRELTVALDGLSLQRSVAALRSLAGLPNPT